MKRKPLLVVVLLALGLCAFYRGSGEARPSELVADASLAPSDGEAALSATAPGIDPDATTRHAPASAVPWTTRVRGILGYGVLLLLALLLSNQRKAIAWRQVGMGLALQAAFALIVLNPTVGQFFFNVVDVGVRKLLSFADAGISFVFSSTAPHQMTYLNEHGHTITSTFVGTMSPALKCFAFSVLPTIIFFSALFNVLYYFGVMQFIVKWIARAMMYGMRSSGAETLTCAANIFVGQTEAPLLVRPFIEKMTMSELMAVMTSGFATLAGGVIALYVAMLKGVPGIAGHLVTAMFMAAPCALALSKLVIPETETPVSRGKVVPKIPQTDRNVIEAAARGATDGISLVLNVAAVLIAFVAMVAMLNAMMGVVGGWLHHLLSLGGLDERLGFLVPTSLQQILGWVLSPLAWLMGVPWSEAQSLGGLLGEKLILTELLAYSHLQGLLAGAGAAVVSRRTAVMAAYSLSGFANIASIGIQIGGIGAMAPSRRGDLARLGLRAMLTGAIVSCLSATIAGFFV